MATLATPIADAEEWHNPNKVKVVCDARGDALYFSRSPIPLAARRRRAAREALRHIGVYAYRRDFLLRFAALEPGVLEALKSSNNCARSSAAIVSGWWLPWRRRLR